MQRCSSSSFCPGNNFHMYLVQEYCTMYYCDTYASFDAYVLTLLRSEVWEVSYSSAISTGQGISQFHILIQWTRMLRGFKISGITFPWNPRHPVRSHHYILCFKESESADASIFMIF